MFFLYFAYIKDNYTHFTREFSLILKKCFFKGTKVWFGVNQQI